MADGTDATTTDRVERELFVRASTEEVWETVTGSGWLADEVQLDLNPGGDARFRSPDRTGWVEEASPPERGSAARLVFWWGEDGCAASRVELEIEPTAPARTLVRVTETRPLEVLDVTGFPIPGSDQVPRGPLMLATV